MTFIYIQTTVLMHVSNVIIIGNKCNRIFDCDWHMCEYQGRPDEKKNWCFMLLNEIKINLFNPVHAYHQIMVDHRASALVGDQMDRTNKRINR